MHRLGSKLAVLLLAVGAVLGADSTPPPPPLPSELPVLAPVQSQPARRIIPVTRPARHTNASGAVSLPQFPTRPLTNLNPQSSPPGRYQPTYVPEDILKWDGTEKEVHAKEDDLDIPF